MTGVALDRDALYYPRIHVPDANWLKATLLCFPRVVRIVPRWYHLQDDIEVAEFARLNGPHGPLLSAADLSGRTIDQAQRTLVRQMQEHEGFILERYSEKVTRSELGKDADSFEIHGEKLLSDLAEYLRSRRLAWHSRRRDTDHFLWLAVHPRLGRAIMGTLAIAVANNEGLDIVTPSDEDHIGLVRSTDEDAFSTLLGDVMPKPPRRQDLVDDLTEVVMLTTFDLARLTPRNISDLISDGKDLREFKGALVEVAAALPDITDEAKRKERLEAAAEEVRNRWASYRRSLPRFAAEALTDATDIKWPELASWAAVQAGASIVHLGAAVGFGLAAVTYAGVRVFRSYRERLRSPYRYLSRVHDAGATTLNIPLRRTVHERSR